MIRMTFTSTRKITLIKIFKNGARYTDTIVTVCHLVPSPAHERR